MKKIIVLGLLLSICLTFTSCGNSFEMKVTDIKSSYREGTFVFCEVTKGVLKDGERVTIERDGKTIKSVKVEGLINIVTAKEVKSISKGDNVKVYLGGTTVEGLPVIAEEDLSPNDMIVK